MSRLVWSRSRSHGRGTDPAAGHQRALRLGVDCPPLGTDQRDVTGEQAGATIVVAYVVAGPCLHTGGERPVAERRRDRRAEIGGIQPAELAPGAWQVVGRMWRHRQEELRVIDDKRNPCRGSRRIAEGGAGDGVGVAAHRARALEEHVLLRRGLGAVLAGADVAHGPGIQQFEAIGRAQRIGRERHGTEPETAALEHHRHLESCEQRPFTRQLTFDQEADVLTDAAAEQQCEFVRELDLAAVRALRLGSVGVRPGRRRCSSGTGPW